MQIEFERLVQLADPNYVIDKKIDSDTIFYFLNAYQERWIKQNYVNVDATRTSIETLHKTLDAFKSLIVSTTLKNGSSLPDYDYATRFSLPSNSTNKFYLYLRSESNVSGTYMDVTGSTTEYNIDINRVLPIINQALPTHTTNTTDVLPGYIIPSVYTVSGVTYTEGPVWITDPNNASYIDIGFFYKGVLYYKWESNSTYKNYMSYVNQRTITVSGIDYQINTPIATAIYKDVAGNYYNSSFVQITVSTSTTDKQVKVSNKLISHDEVEKILVTYYNKPILRQPCVVLDSDVSKDSYITVYTDSYTSVHNCTVTYVRKPRKFNVINVNNDSSIVDQCELADNIHQEIVEGAVDMFIREGAYRLQVKQDNNQNQQ